MREETVHIVPPGNVFPNHRHVSMEGWWHVESLERARWWNSRTLKTIVRTLITQINSEGMKDAGDIWCRPSWHYQNGRNCQVRVSKFADIELLLNDKYEALFTFWQSTSVSHQESGNQVYPSSPEQVEDLYTPNVFCFYHKPIIWEGSWEYCLVKPKIIKIIRYSTSVKEQALSQN
jgi:hypothetical protein